MIDTRLEKHRKPLSLKEFNAKHRNFYRLEENKKGKVKRIQIAEEWLGDIHRKSVTALIYKPSDKDLITNQVDNTVYYNTFFWPKHIKPSRKIDLKMFYEHINYLFPKREEAEWFLDWLAFNIQCPELRSPIAPLHMSIHQGTGRGWLVKAITKLLGEHNISKTEIDAFAEKGSRSQFNGYLNKSKVCFVEEMKQKSKHHFALVDRIKSVITDEYQSYNLKGKREFTAPCYANLFFMSNHRDAIVLRPEDRRLNVFYCSNEPKKSEYYTKLYEWIENSDNISGLFYELKNRKLDVKAFKSQKVMKNKAREMLIENTTSDYEFAFIEFLEDNKHPWLTFKQILSFVDKGYNKQSNITYLSGGSENEAQLKKLLISNPKVEISHKQIRLLGKPQRAWCLNLECKDWDKPKQPVRLKKAIEDAQQEIEAEQDKANKKWANS